MPSLRSLTMLTCKVKHVPFFSHSERIILSHGHHLRLESLPLDEITAPDTGRTQSRWLLPIQTLNALLSGDYKEELRYNLIEQNPGTFTEAKRQTSASERLTSG